MKELKILGAAFLAVALSACGSSSSSSPPAGFTQPAGTVAVNFSVDDTANKVFTAGQLQWKGSMLYDTTHRTVTSDSTWGGPWATLYDDGPWTAGGHEPEGAVAGDHIWGVTVFATPPATGSTTYSYGCNDALYQTDYGNGWIWIGSNGNFVVAAGATAPVTAAGLTLPKFGTTDMKLSIDTSQLIAGTWDTTKVTVKSSAWAWGEVTVPKPASGTVYTLDMSTIVPPACSSATPPCFVHTGLLSSGAKPEWVWVFNGVEYKDPSGSAATGGVTAATKASGGSFTSQAVVLCSDNNTCITVP